jgi:hypothetical protein
MILLGLEGVLLEQVCLLGQAAGLGLLPGQLAVREPLLQELGHVLQPARVLEALLGLAQLGGQGLVALLDGQVVVLEQAVLRVDAGLGHALLAAGLLQLHLQLVVRLL